MVSADFWTLTLGPVAPYHISSLDILARVNLGEQLAKTIARVPVTKLGRLVKDGKIKSMEEIYLFSLPVKEFQVIDIFLPALKDEVMSIAPVQKQTSAGQRTRFKAFVAVGDFDGYVLLPYSSCLI